MIKLKYSDFTRLAADIKALGKKLGFQEVRIASLELTEANQQLKAWLNRGFHGAMGYMAQNLDKRADPAKLHPGTLRVITVRLDYLPQDDHGPKTLQQKHQAYIARYALGRDYHKVIRKKLTRLAKLIEEQIGPFGYRAFTDSAPILERALAANSGLGWIGKNTMLINRKAGSWFFLGELYTDLPLPIDEGTTAHCGSCTACINICPTKAIVAPYQLDARKCISYLTIENKGSIPAQYRKAMGNRIFGCDDCQLICPWNKFAKHSTESDFTPRHQLNNIDLITLFNWDEKTFLTNTAGSAIRRTGYIGWLRNIAVALGNAPRSNKTIAALQARLTHPSEMVVEHVNWALAEQQKKADNN
jgi:epoxyqueuosine reductase